MEITEKSKRRARARLLALAEANAERGGELDPSVPFRFADLAAKGFVLMQEGDCLNH